MAICRAGKDHIVRRTDVAVRALGVGVRKPEKAVVIKRRSRPCRGCVARLAGRGEAR